MAAKKKRSGATQTPEERRAAGRVRVELWLSEEHVGYLDDLTTRGDCARSVAIARAIELAWASARWKA